MSMKSAAADDSIAAPIDWDSIHSAVQSALTRLAVHLVERDRAVEITEARTSGRAFFLHSCRRITPSTGTGEAIVVGVSFLPRGDLTAVEGDIAGEETGQIYFTAPSSRVVKSAQDDVSVAARTVAEELADQAPLLLKTLPTGYSHT